ncbi:Altered inheritance of mitochondria protein 6 [Ciborinia camelliae]|nr:Altered inheritance of mitochondria protein 6 [Ciborinia camelliae]
MSHLPSTRHGIKTTGTERYDEIINASRNSIDDDIQPSNGCGSSSIPFHSPMEKSINPTASFDYSDAPTLQDEFISRLRSTSQSRKTRYWWNKMGVKGRRKQSFDEIEDIDTNPEVGDGLLTGLHTISRWQRRKNGIFNYFVFGGISGLGILLILLLINLILGAATLLWAHDIDDVLKNWGKSGTGTEDLAWYPTDFTRDINPIPCHSHNDYWRRVPLFDALRVGCTGVEADVWLFDNDLYVGHNTAALQRNRTFQSLYINPLVDILKRQNPTTDFYNGSSHGVFDADDGKSLILLVDVKTGGEETWPWVLEQLEPLRKRGWLSYMENDTLHTRPITVVGTGNTPFDILTKNSTYRDAFFDSPLESMWEPRNITEEVKDWPDDDIDIDSEHEPTQDIPIPNQESNQGQGMSGVSSDTQFNTLNSYYASVSFNKAVGRIWRGKISPRQLKIIRGHIRGAHRRGLKVRYWDLPSWPIGLRNHVWDVLVKEGVDYLNVDDLRAAAKGVW